ncbi:cytochrome c biogenesis protein CcsA, partial [Escherichia coli]|nr:cytochrome c biogenesis protein CcsA [Escherichia coli]
GGGVWGGGWGGVLGGGGVGGGLDGGGGVFWCGCAVGFGGPVPELMGVGRVGFLRFILFYSNPFSRTLPNFPIEGRDLNPLLQDPGLIFHPPLLYMGYWGFPGAFAFAIPSFFGGLRAAPLAGLLRPGPGGAGLFVRP